MGTGLDIWVQGWMYGYRAGCMGTGLDIWVQGAGLDVWVQGWIYGYRAGYMGIGLDIIWVYTSILTCRQNANMV